jgi:phosphatidylglycerophosphate synthase
MNNLLVIAGFISTLVTGSFSYWIGISALSFGIYLIKLPNSLPEFPFLIGYPNWISLSRLIVILIAVSIHNSLSDLVLFIIFGCVILMDGLDGAVARRFKQTSSAGEYLDMEIDALFVFLISCIHYMEQKLAIWIIIPGSMRYVYGLLFFWMQEPLKTKPGKRIRSTIAALFFISLLFPFILSKEIYTPLVFFSSSLIIISFGISIVNRVIFHFNFNRSSDLS